MSLRKIRTKFRWGLSSHPPHLDPPMFLQNVVCILFHVLFYFIITINLISHSSIVLLKSIFLKIVVWYLSF